ncbi:hypothetical protein QJS04_geneDACA001544 [Acorus gramineus]|uniref:CUE domain-containing protein n=1 Tax=Acorus gramineus TaxID=55184 RepID=A0AAV9BFR3_ACOGR|nr:hypothetical protein QJS04_geneDACA001544 [Acorus gramineus]
MSAAVCGKRPFIDDQLYNNSPPTPSSPSNKRLRRFSPTPPRPTSSAAEERERFTSRLDHLRSLFPGMDAQILENAFEACGYDLDSTIKKLNELWLGSAKANLASGASEFDSGNGGDGHQTSQNILPIGVNGTAAEISPSMENLPTDGSEWVELFVKEMMNASDICDAKARAARALEALEKSILARASTEAAESFQKEYTNLKDQVETLLRDNNILKRAVTIQHERQKNYDERNQEVQHLRQLVSQYQEQLRALEVNNYSLSLHLKQAQQSSSIPGRFHPDVF